MQTFICEFDDEGVVRRQTVEAESADEAVKRMRNMDFDVRRIGTSGNDLEPVPRPDTPVVTPQRVTISVESEEELPEDIPEEHPFEDPLAIPHPTVNPASVAPLPPTMGEKQHFPAIIEDNNPPDDPPPPKEVTKFIDVHRRHTMLVGEHAEIRKRLDHLLNNEYGAIMHLAMHPDMKKGAMVLAVVVEHDEPIKKV